MNCFSHGTIALSKDDVTKIKTQLGLKTVQNKNNFQILVEYIVDISKKYKYKRKDGWIMKPNNKIPIVYQNCVEYREYLNEIFSDKTNTYFFDLFRKSANMIDNLEKYLMNIDDPDFSFIKINKYIFAFNNGYLDINDLHNIKFNAYDKNNIPPICTTKYFNIDFNISWLSKIEQLQTPAFDNLCLYHFAKNENYEIFLGMMGRLHYPIGKYDKFNCVPFIKGGSNTGKSTLGNIIMNNHQNIGTISGKMEDTFGLQSLYKKSIIYIQECPKNLPQKLDKGDLQRMIEASRIDIPIKTKSSLNDFLCDIPMLFIGNYFPKYA